MTHPSLLARESAVKPGRVLIISDPQYATSNDPSIFADQITWVIAQSPDLVVLPGDLVDDNVTGVYLPNWPVVQTQLGRLTAAGIKWAAVPGNHDYLPILTRTTLINTYVQLSSWLTPMTAGHVENTWGLVTLAGREWLVVCLEWLPRDAVVTWAAGIIDAHPGMPVMLVTHCWLNWDGTQETAATAIGSVLETTPTEGHSAGAELWANLASARSAVRIVLCGHVDADYDGAQIVRHRTNTRGDGTVCHQIECNYQYQVPYGGGWVSDLRFDEANQNLSYEAYSPYYGQVRYRSQDRFALVMP
jgi:hypothetical protein